MAMARQAGRTAADMRSKLLLRRPKSRLLRRHPKSLP